MQFHILLYSLVFLLSLAGNSFALDEGLQHSIAFIECSSPDSKNKTAGTGVVIDSSGLILTAKHVAPPGFSCKVSFGVAESPPTRVLIPRHRSANFDAMTFKVVLEPGETFTPFGCLEITRNTTRGITAFGFFGDTGEVSQRTGEIATTVPDAEGFIQTTAMTAKKMSGGPVLHSETTRLVGIIAGGQTDNQGLITHFEVLSIDMIRNELLPDKCFDEGGPKVVNEVVYFRKQADDGKVDAILKEIGVTYNTDESKNLIKTNWITCSKSFPIADIRKIALSLHDNGFPIYSIYRNFRDDRRRINIESYVMDDYLPMTREEIEKYKECDKRPPRLKPRNITVRNQCDYDILAILRYRTNLDGLWKFLEIPVKAKSQKLAMTFGQALSISGDAYIQATYDTEFGEKVFMPREDAESDIYRDFNTPMGTLRMQTVRRTSNRFTFCVS